jgi:hypothetical protein
MLILDVRTRWGSTFAMLERALLMRPAIERMVQLNPLDLGEYKLSDMDWLIIKTVRNWLEKFAFATKKLSTAKKPMISSIMTIYLDLMIDVKAMIESLPTTAPRSLKQGMNLSAIAVFQAYAFV